MPVSSPYEGKSAAPRDLRKEAASVRINGTTWSPQCEAQPSHASRPSFLRAIQKALLPQPSVRGQRSRLASDVLADFALIFCAFWITGGLQSSDLWVPFLASDSRFAGGPGMRPALLYGILFTLLGYSERLYQTATIQSARDERAIVVKCVLCSTLFMAMAGEIQTRGVLLAILAFANYGLLLARREARRRSVRSPGSARDLKNVLIVGAGPLAQKVAEHLQRSPLEKRATVGFLDESAPIGGAVRGRIKDLPLLAQTEFVGEVILAGVERKVALRAIWEARQNGIDIKAVPDLFGLDPDPLLLERIGDVPILTLRQERIPPLGLAVKRVVDILGSGAGLILSSPILAMITAAIRLDSPGPVLYRAPRVGFKGRRFLCYKFRTMIVDADQRKDELRAHNERSGAFFKIQNDPRITRVGRILRRYSLDELPQLWNVLRGEMSLVGPRPHPLDDFACYRTQDLKRLEAIPGLTGLWQVTARQDPSFERNLALDREYIEHWSPATDFRIVLKTVAAVLHGSGS